MTYKESNIVAIEDLKDRNGSSMISVKKNMQAGMPKDKKWQNATCLTALKTMVTKGDLTQIKNSYKLYPALKKAKIDANKPKKVAPKKNNPVAPKKNQQQPRKRKLHLKSQLQRKRRLHQKRSPLQRKRLARKQPQRRNQQQKRSSSQLT